ncbi:MAG: hypothetical protein FWF49_04705, partial [Oscillospiraceae bacterium]|nr:hypothetical protein [Oscillospiraceae bacterium]
FALAEIDGDALPEIVVQIDMGGNGGMGSYTQCVLKYDAAHKSFLELLKIDVPIDTGFTALFQNNYKMNVINTYADYSRIVDVSQDDRDSYYNADGTYIREKADILLDTCYYFYPEDVNSDGTAEIKTLQYVSLNSRSDCVGLATTTLKYDTVESKFVVIEAAFNLPNEMPMDSVLTPFYGYPGAYPNIQ